MKISLDNESKILFKEVFDSVGFESRTGEKFYISMRDGGFEFFYNNKMYSAKDGKLEFMCCKPYCGSSYCDENGCMDRKRDNVNLIDIQTN